MHRSGHEVTPLYDTDTPWNVGVAGEQLLPLINDNASVIRCSAGPGTGKTFGLRRRVLRLLHPSGLGAESGRVLVCAFNRVIARDLRSEIEEELEPHGLETPVVRTIHALCVSLLEDVPRPLLPHETEIMVYDVRAQYPAVNELFERSQRVALRALREHEAQAEHHPELAQAVREWLADHRAGLVGDAPREVESLLRGGTVPDRLYEHVIVDEFQDLSESEARVVVGLRAEYASLTAVGDRKQSIYAFRGNADKGLELLPELVGSAPIVDHPMDECRRCPAEIVRLANAVMALEGEPLRDVRGEGGEIHRVHHTTPEVESNRMAKEILRVYESRPNAKHLVLVTRRRWGYDLRAAIRCLDEEAPVQTVFAEDPLETWPAREAVMFFSIVAEPNDPVNLRAWLGYQEPAEGRSFKAMRRNAPAYVALRADKGVLSLEIALQLAEADERSFSGSGRRNLLERLTRLRDLHAELPSSADPAVIIDHIFDTERWINLDGDDATLARDDLCRLKSEVERLAADHESLAELARALRFRIATREPLDVDAEAAIRIVTLWGAKGLTADHVYVVGLCDEALPGPHDPDSTGLTTAQHLSEQRRLLYVSLTRAKESLVISRASKIRRGQVSALGLSRNSGQPRYWQDLRWSQFFDDLPPGALADSVPGTNWQGVSVH